MMQAPYVFLFFILYAFARRSLVRSLSRPNRFSGFSSKIKKEKPRFGQNTTHHQNKPSFAAPITVSEAVPRYFACDMRAFPR